MIVADIRLTTAPENPGMPLRRLEIRNLDEVPADRDWDEVSTYEVRSVLPKSGTVRAVAEFRHRYGDDQCTLVLEAIEALGGRVGLHDGMSREERRAVTR